MTKLAAVIAALLLLPSATALAQTTKTVTVPGTVVFQHGAKPTDPGNCSAIVFVQWTNDAKLKVLSARAVYTWAGAEESEIRQAPFDDTYDWVRIYTVPPGSHWIAVTKSWADGPHANDCGDMNATHQAQIPNRQARVELTVDNTAACAAARTKLTKASRAVSKAQTARSKAKSAKAKRRAGAKLRSARAGKKKADKAVTAEC